MQLSAYTPDAICQSMGLPGFIEKKWPAPTLRLLLKPSFHPEVCLTLSQSAKTRLSVIAFEQSLWKQPAPCALATWREENSVADETFARLVTAFHAGWAAEKHLEGRMVCLDGMPICACLSHANDSLQLDTHPYRPEVRGFVSSFIALAAECCRYSRVRNALADCGDYVGLKLQRSSLPPSQPLYRIAVLGDSEERADYLRQLPTRDGEFRVDE